MKAGFVITGRFLHGQELIFSTGIGHDNNDRLLDLVKGLVANQASGLVLNPGPYIKSVPENLISYCREVQFPLFTMPWKTRIVDVTNDFCRKIIKSEENEVTVAGVFRNAIFSPEKITEYRSVLELKELDMDAEFRIVAISLQVPSNDRFSEYDKSVRLHLTKILFKYSDRFNIFRQDKYLIAVLQNFPQDVVESALDQLNEVCSYIDQSCRIRAGISINDFDIKSLPRNYKRAVAILPIAEKQDKVKLSYSNVGIYQLLTEIEDIKALRRFYEDTSDACADPEAAGKIVYEADKSVSLEYQTYMAKEIAKLVVPKGFDPAKIGNTDMAAIQQTADLALKYGLLSKAAVISDDTVTNTYWQEATAK